MHTWQRYSVRGPIALSAGVAVFTLAAFSPALWDSALLAGWDVGVITWLLLTFFAIRQADAQRTWEQSRALEPETLYMLVIVIITSAVGLVGSITLSTRLAARSPLQQDLHFASGVLAVVLSWLFVHTEFGLYYARLYYDQAAPDTLVEDGGGGAFIAFRMGLAFPEGELVDYWAFPYYSFTVGMCYQTSDVTITSPWMRRRTLLHAFVSFAFVLIILGYTVSSIGALI
jgi:uncharacterized membrane protein